MLYKFLAEYAADDEEAFQNSNAGIFDSELLSDIRNRYVREPVLIDILPKVEMPRAQ